jgi:nitrogen fixation protein NifU and related proteins
MDLYRDIILDHYHNPRNFGHLDKPDVVQEDNNVSCGDRVVMEVQFNKENGKKIVKEIRFSGEGCAINQASASLLTEFVKGKTIQEIEVLGLPTVLELLGTTLTPSRIKCAILPLEVLQKAIKIADTK